MYQLACPKSTSDVSYNHAGVYTQEGLQGGQHRPATCISAHLCRSHDATAASFSCEAIRRRRAASVGLPAVSSCRRSHCAGQSNMPSYNDLPLINVPVAKHPSACDPLSKPPSCHPCGVKQSPLPKEPFVFTIVSEYMVQ